MARPSFQKVVVSGNIYEVYDFEKPAFEQFESKGGRRRQDEEQSKRGDENRKLSCYRAREKVRRLVLANFSEVKHAKFMTLTFRDGEVENVWSLKETNPLFKKFIMRLNYWVRKHRNSDFKLRYVAVIEFQDKNGRGAVHYHMISNLPYIEHEKLTELWRHGWVGINSLDGKYRKDGKDVDNVGAYVVKYMHKNLDDPRLKGQKSYLISRGLKHSEVYRGDQAKLIVETLGFENKDVVYTSSYESEHHGIITYREFNLKRCTGNTAK